MYIVQLNMQCRYIIIIIYGAVRSGGQLHVLMSLCLERPLSL